MNAESGSSITQRQSCRVLETQYFTTGHKSKYAQRVARRGTWHTYLQNFFLLAAPNCGLLHPRAFSKVISPLPPTRSIRAGLGRPWPKGQIQPAACFHKPRCTGPQAGPVLERGRRKWPAKLKVFTAWPFTGKVC